MCGPEPLTLDSTIFEASPTPHVLGKARVVIDMLAETIEERVSATKVFLYNQIFIFLIIIQTTFKSVAGGYVVPIYDILSKAASVHAPLSHLLALILRAGKYYSAGIYHIKLRIGMLTWGYTIHELLQQRSVCELHLRSGAAKVQNFPFLFSLTVILDP